MTAAYPIPTLEIGSRVGAYRIVGELGGGGMGMVYRAVHMLLDRPAAIKVLRSELGNHTMAIERFLTEARATTAIRHPGIVEIYDYGHTAAGNAYIAMELLEGETLGARMAARGTVMLFEAMTLARRIAAPLAVAHDRGIVHRDLKPDNVFLVRDHEGGVVDQVKILDFGIAKLEKTAASSRTTIGLILGTPAYMSPEQCRGSSDCDHRTDLYALGCILFELLTGQPPYGSSLASAELFAAHLQAPVPDLGRLVAVPPEIVRLVTRLLAKRPDDRPRNALEVIAEIDGWFALRSPSAPPRRKTLRISIVAASGILVSLAALGVWYRRAHPGAIGKRHEDSAVRLMTPPSVSPALAAPTGDAAINSPIALPSPPPPAPNSSPPPSLPPLPSSPPPPSSPPVHTRDIPLPPASRPAQRPITKTHGAHSSQPGEVTSELGEANPGDVNTTVSDFDHN